MKALLDHYADYGNWANQRFFERLEQLPEEVLDRPVPNSFPTLRATLLHIRDAEHTWWCRLTNTPSSWPAQPETGIGTLLPHSARFNELVRSMDEEALLRQHSYPDLRGNVHTQEAWQMIMHCLNHSTQHRGQLITMMRALGLTDIPANDMVVFQRLSASRS